ncbi:MTH1187 family thiamine-binding protein [Bacillus cereus]
MAIVDVSIIPVGTGNPSVSEYVAEVQKVLEKNADRVKYQLTPMNTIIEGDLPVILEVIQQMHEVPYTKGARRVATTIRIDDRRDKVSTMEKKLNSVRSKL